MMMVLSGRIKMSRITILPPSLLVMVVVIVVVVSIFDCCNNNQNQNIINNVGITATTTITTTTGVVTAFIVVHQQQQQYNSQSKSRNININNVFFGNNNNPLLSQERYSSYSSAVKVVSPLLSLSSDSTDGGPLSDLSDFSSSSLSSSSSGGGGSSAEEDDDDGDDQWVVCSSSSSSSSSNPRRQQQRRYSREMAQTLLNTNDFLPSNKYSDRIGFGRIAVEKEYNNNNKNENNKPQIMKANDPRLKMTYAEFPLSSYDILLDKAITYLSTKRKSKTAKTNLVDIGSGLGRIVLYTALTRGGKSGKEEEEEEEEEENWNISGIEIISGLHDKALQLVQTGIETGIFCSSTTATTTTTTTTTNNSNTGTVSDNNDDCNSFSFHLGSFIENNNSKETITTSTTSTTTTIQKVLNEADLIFMYSTAFTATQFNPDPDVCALLLDGKEWSQPLSELCQNGCIVITTDKALDPYYGWKIIDRIEKVPNPEVLDSTGFIHILNK